MAFSQEKINKIYDKYKENDMYRCAYCGFEIYTDLEVDNAFKATIDHVNPTAKGGSDALTNLVPSCYMCNHVKDDMTLEEFRNALLIGKITHKKHKNGELNTLKTTRYMIPYGRYTGFSGYMWGGKFYFEKSKTERKNVSDMIKTVQPMQMNGVNPSSIIDDYFKENPTTIKKSTASDRISVNDIEKSVNAKKINNKNIIIVTGEKPAKIKPVAADKVVKKTTISRTERKVLYSVYDYKCAYCGCELLCDTKEFGHANACPSRLNPADGYVTDNCAASCHECENIKGKLSLEEFRELIFPDKAHNKEKLMRFIERNYRAFPVKKFYFELTESQKAGVDAYWKTIAQRDVSGKHILDNKNGKEKIASFSEQLKETLFPKEKALPQKPDIDADIDIEKLTVPLKEQYEELAVKRRELIEKANLIGESMIRIKQAIDVIESTKELKGDMPEYENFLRLLG